MPSKSEKQARFFAACSHGAGYDSCPSQKVSKEFNQADKGSKLLSSAMKHYKTGGRKNLNTKEEVNYRNGYGGNRCANCTMYRNPHSCTAVEGYIKPSDLCDLFERKKR